MKQRILGLAILLLFSTLSVFSQDLTAKGKVIDENNDPLPVVTIRVKGDTKKGAFSGADGNFLIQVKKGDVLIFSFLGYKTQEMKASANMQVKLEPDIETLEDVVVIGYMPRKITNTSASVVKVSAKELSNKPAANPMDAIQGKVTGLQVFSNSGEPSAELSIALHGQGSLGAGTGPLFILDGMQVSSGVIKAMNPNDFESMQFLKDASATSIYGARAANGVVYITSKRGTSGEQASITVRAQYGVSTLANTAYFDQMMTSDELINYYVETGLRFDPNVEPTKDNWIDFRNKIFGDVNFKWYDYIYKPAPLYQADVAVSGGSSKTNYYLSAGGMSQKGLREGSKYDKIFSRFNFNSELNSYVRLGLNASITYDWTQRSPLDNDSPLGGMGAMNLPFVSPYDKDGKEMEFIDVLGIGTPGYEIQKKPAMNESFMAAVSGNVVITPIRNLTIRSLAGIELSYGKSFSRILPSYRRAYGNGSSARSFGQALNFSTSNTISYNMKFGNNHYLTALAGQEYIDYFDDSMRASGNGLKHDELVSLNMATLDRSFGENFTDYAFLSFFGQFAYNYSDLYFLDLVIRNDASSRFGPHKRNATFWSAGFLWKMKNEKFLSDVKWLNELDFKASYGTQGNSSIPPYYTTSYAGRGGQYRGELALGLTNTGNPDLGWERQSKLTVGFKTRILGRIGLNLEYYHRLTTDMLFDVPVDYTSGYGMGRYGYPANIQNDGAYLNQGIDIRLTGDILMSKDYYLSSYINFNYNRDKVLALFEGRQSFLEPGTTLAYVVGKPVTIYMPIFKGVNPDTGRPEWYKPSEDPTVMTKDDNNLTDEYLQTLEQNTNIPAYTPMTGGWGIDGRWKGFFVSADFSFAIGKTMISKDRQYFESDANVRNFEANNFNGSRKLFNYWKKPGDHADYPSLDYQREKNTIRPSLYFDTGIVEDASFMRMKNLTVGYDLPKSLLEKQSVLKSARVFFTGRNLLTFTKFQGIDPEVNTIVSVGVNPNTKQVSINFELGF